MELFRKTARNGHGYALVVRSFSALLVVSSMTAGAVYSKPHDYMILASEKANATADKEYLHKLKYLKNLEDRFFFHSYDHDPPEKRVERLELLIFGGAKYGVVEERIDRLKKAIRERDRKAALKMKENAGEEDEAGKSAQYPILNTLEWRVLKKTYRDESLDSRLERLETKLFGKSSPAMSYADRIDRLKKIVGISVTSLPPRSNKIMPGPLPRAQQDGKTIIVPFGNMPNLNPDSEQFQEDFNRQMMKDLPNMMKYMNKQLRDMFETGPKNKHYTIPPNNNSPIIVPNKKPKVTIPPYADPNSI